MLQQFDSEFLTDRTYFYLSYFSIWRLQKEFLSLLWVSNYFPMWFQEGFLHRSNYKVEIFLDMSKHEEGSNLTLTVTWTVLYVHNIFNMWTLNMWPWETIFYTLGISRTKIINSRCRQNLYPPLQDLYQLHFTGVNIIFFSSFSIFVPPSSRFYKE